MSPFRQSLLVLHSSAGAILNNQWRYFVGIVVQSPVLCDNGIMDDFFCDISFRPSNSNAFMKPFTTRALSALPKRAFSKSKAAVFNQERFKELSWIQKIKQRNKKNACKFMADNQGMFYKESSLIKHLPGLINEAPQTPAETKYAASAIIATAYRQLCNFHI